MNARDALEVVRRLTGGYKDREHALASGDVPIALSALTALVERAGEPVAWKLVHYDAITLIGVLRDQVMIDDHEYWLLRDAIRIGADYNHRTTAPGASHER